MRRLKCGSPGILQVDVGANGSVEFSFACSRVAAVVVNAGGGNDTVTIDELCHVFTTTELTTRRAARATIGERRQRGRER